MSVETGPTPSLGAILEPDAADAALSLELYSWPQDRPVAQSLSPMAHRNLHWRQNDPDRIPGILGILVDRAHQPVALPEVDSGDGSLRPSRSEKPLTFSSLIVAKLIILSEAKDDEAVRALYPLPHPITTFTSLPLPTPSS